jgi:tetratricopeptide (TPR) repeat protein
VRTSELNQLIESPERLQKDQINDLQDLISEYPYFTSAQLLLTKAFFENENLNFEKQLRLSAAYAGDRKKLHDLLYSGREMSDEVFESSDGQSSDFKSEDDQVSEKGITEENAGLGHRSLSEVEGRPSNLSTEQSEVDEQAQADQDFLDAQIMSAAIGNTIVDELETGDQKSEIRNQTSDISTSLDVTDEKSEMDESVSDPSASSGQRLRSSISEESETFDESQPHSFSDWIKHYGRNEKPGLDPRTRNSPIGEASAEPNPVIQSISKQVKEIQEKAEFYSASKMAKLSVTESDDLVTETLAKVFEDQGKYEKAIKAYEKLRLKFPEKSVYFAGRIKAVEKKLKS